MCVSPSRCPDLHTCPGHVSPPTGIPRALLGHQVAVVGLRPSFPDFTPFEYRNLAEQCWLQEPDRRWGVAKLVQPFAQWQCVCVAAAVR